MSTFNPATPAMNLPNYDSWKTGAYDRFEHDQARKNEVYDLALSERDSELRTDPATLAEVFSEFYPGDPLFERWKALLQAAAQHKPPRQIGEALTRLVNDMIDADALYHAEEESAS